MQDRILNKLFEPFYNYFLILLLGYEKVELFRCKRAVTKVFLRKGSYLRNRQYSFILKTTVVCIVWNFLLKDILVNKLDSINNIIKSNLLLDVHQILHITITILIIIFIHVCITAWINQTFNNHLYGYKIKIGKLKKEFQYTKKVQVVNFVYLLLDFLGLGLYFFNEKNKDYLIFCSLLAIGIGIVILTIVWIDLLIFSSKSKRIITFYVREQKSEIEKNKYDTVDGEKDITIVKKDGTTENLNLFENNLFIVKNNNILVLGKTANKLYSKKMIKSIEIDNKHGFKKTIKYKKNAKKWVAY